MAPLSPARHRKSSAPPRVLHHQPNPHPAAAAKSAPAPASHPKTTQRGFTSSHQHAPNGLKRVQQGKQNWLDKAMAQSGQKISNHEVLHETQAVQDYVGNVRHSRDAQWSHTSMKNAGIAMRKLDVLSKSTKLSQHDREAIAATRRIYNNYRNLKPGKTQEDPDVRLLKWSHERHVAGAGDMTRLPENSQLAKNQRLPQEKSPMPKRLEAAKPGHEPKYPKRMAQVRPPKAPRPVTPREIKPVSNQEAKRRGLPVRIETKA